jgi:hypothetical protein
MKKKKKEKKEWKFGKGWKGTERAMELHHPDKFSKEACAKDYEGDKLCPYAVAASMKKKGFHSKYKDQPSTLKGKPKKKKKFREWVREHHGKLD